MKKWAWSALSVAFLTATGSVAERDFDLVTLGQASRDLARSEAASASLPGTEKDPLDNSLDAQRLVTRRRPRRATVPYGPDDNVRAFGGNGAPVNNGQLHFEAVALSEIGSDPELASAWDRQVRDAWNLYAMYQSREWLACAPSVGKQTLLVDRRQAPAGHSSIAPLSFETVPLRFQVRGVRFDLEIPCLEVLGGQPLLNASSYDDYVALVNAIWRMYPQVQGIYFKSVPDEAPLWQILRDHGWRVGDTVAYRPEGDRPFHYLALPETFEDYLGEFRKKRRYNLKRQVRVMSETYPDLNVRCITDSADVPFLVQSVETITPRSWKASPAAEIANLPDNLEQIARRGLLRSYVMSVQGQPCAYIIGYQFNGIYHYANIGYDGELAAFSPGNVLLLLVIQDLIEATDARFMNFGITDAEYKRVFGNRHIQDASLLLLRPNLTNHTKRTLHMGFQSAKNLARDVHSTTRSWFRNA